MSTIEAGRRTFGKHDSTIRDGMSLEAVAASARRLDELSCARVVGNAADLVHAAQKTGQPLGTLTPAAIVVRGDGSVTLVPSAALVGYTAPEKLRGGAGDRRADVFALGAILWEVLVGEPLFDGPDDAAIRSAVLDREIAAPSEHNANVPDELDAVCLKALARDPADRHASAKVMAAELDALLGDAGYPEANDQIAAYIARALAPPPSTSSGAVAAPLFGYRTAPLPLPSVLPAVDERGEAMGGGGQTLPLGAKSGTQPMPAVEPSRTATAPLGGPPAAPGPRITPPPFDLPRAQTVPLGSPEVLVQPALGSQAAKPISQPPAFDLPRAQTVPLGSPAVLVQPALGSQAAKPISQPMAQASLPLAPLPSLGPITEPSLPPALPPAPVTEPSLPPALPPAPITEPSMRAAPAPITEPSVPVPRTVTPPLKLGKADGAGPSTDKRPLASTAFLGSNAMMDPPLAADAARDTPPPIHSTPEWDTLPSFGPPEMPPPMTVLGVAPAGPSVLAAANARPHTGVRSPLASADTVETPPIAPTVTQIGPLPQLHMPPGMTVTPISPPATLQTADDAFVDEHHADPAQVIALHQAEKRAATSRDMLGGWGWSTGSMAVIEDPDHFDEAARASRRRLVIAIGCALVAAVIIAGVAFAFSKARPGDAASQAAATPSLTAPAAPPSTTAPAAAPAPSPSPAEGTVPAAATAPVTPPTEPTSPPSVEPTSPPATEPAAVIAAEPTTAAPGAGPPKDGNKDDSKAAPPARIAVETKPAPAKPAPAPPARPAPAAPARPAKTAAIKRPEPKPAPARRPPASKAKPAVRGPVDPYETAEKPRVDPAAAYRAGLQQYARGDAAGALAAFRSSVSASPSYAPSWRGLGLVYEKLGDKPQARAAFRRYLQLAPGAGDADQVRDRMERLGP